MVDDRIERNLPSYSLPFDSMIHLVCQCWWRTTFLLIQAPRKTNDREGISEHISQLSVNCIHIFVSFFLPSNVVVH